MTPTSDQTVLITGATSGIGYHTALNLARQGAQVLITGRNTPSLEQLQAYADVASVQLFHAAGLPPASWLPLPEHRPLPIATLANR
jgi:NAD(P)-dependent dehydrogenase (short-subunit alcohol dehydrogenase family)